MVSETKPSTLDILVSNLSKDQLQQFIALFSSQLPSTTTGSNEASTSKQPMDNTGIIFTPSTLAFVGILNVAKHTLSNDTWLIDFGASHHVCHDRSLLKSIDSSATSNVNLPTGVMVKISGVGMVQLNEHITLHNVLYIPEFRLNYSVSVL